MESGPPAWWTSTVPKIPDLGVTEVYSGPKEGGVVADIFIVHGLQVHPEDTWTSKVEHSASSAKKSGGWRKRFFGGSRPTDSSANDTSTTPTCARRGCFWPFDLLPHTLHKARVLVYGYDSHPTYFYKGGTTRMTITAHCEDLMHKVAAMRVECRGRPIIFIAHSLGGILVKGALNEARQMTHQPQYLDIQQSSFAIMFMGTPHQGADYAKWGEMLSNIVGALPGGFSTDSSILRELSPDSETLDGIARRFDEMLDQSIPVPDKVKICSVQEGKGMSAVKGAGSKVNTGDRPLSSVSS